MASRFAKDQPAGYSNYIKNVAIIGAGGRVGTYITNALLATGKHIITAITRSGSTSSFANGVNKKEVDYEEPSTLVEALKGSDLLIITLAVTSAPGTHDKIVQAAQDAGVPWVIPNEFGAGDSSQANTEAIIGVGKEKERRFVDSLDGISWVGIACGFWYEFSLAGGAGDRFGFNVEDGKQEVTLIDDGKALLSVSTYSRVGEAVAALLSLKILPEDKDDKSATLDSFRDAFAYIQSFTVSQKDMWASLMRVTGTKEGDWAVKHAVSKERFESSMAEMKKGNRLAFSRVLYTRMMYPEEPMLFKNSANQVLGLKTEDIDECTKNALQMQKEGAFVMSYGR